MFELQNLGGVDDQPQKWGSGDKSIQKWGECRWVSGKMGGTHARPKAESY